MQQFSLHKVTPPDGTFEGKRAVFVHVISHNCLGPFWVPSSTEGSSSPSDLIGALSSILHTALTGLFPDQEEFPVEMYELMIEENKPVAIFRFYRAVWTPGGADCYPIPPEDAKPIPLVDLGKGKVVSIGGKKNVH